MARSSSHRPIHEPRWSEAQARQELAAFSASGLTATRWCAERGISVQRLRYWRNRLDPSHPGVEQGPAGPTFLAVRVGAAAPATQSDEARWPLELQVGSFVRLRIGAQAPTDLLRRVLAVAFEVAAC
jgi:hypothetical protein